MWKHLQEDLFSSSQIRQTVLLSLWSFVFVIPVLVTTQLNIVTLTFTDGASRYWSGISPYLPATPGADVFHYPPFFAFLYGPLISLHPIFHALLWAWINCFVFWLGVMRWIPVQRSWDWGIWLAFALCAMELDISLRYQQSNAMVMGLVLLAMAYLKTEAFIQAGFYFALGAHIKVFPAVLALCFIFKSPRRFALSFLLFLGILFLVPGFFVGFSYHFQLHWEQIAALARDLPQRNMIDLASALNRWGYSDLASVSRYLIIGGASVFLGASLIFAPLSTFPIKLWLALFLATFLLLSPRTESPSFVFFAPCYVFLTEAYRRWWRLPLFLSMACVTFIYSSLYPKILKLPIHEYWSSKPFGLFFLWGFAVLAVGRLFWPSFVQASRKWYRAGLLGEFRWT